MRPFLNVIRDALDILLPRSERRKRAEALDARAVPVHPKTFGTPPIATILDYKNTRVQDLIRSAKYDASGAAAEVLAEILGEYLQEEVAHARLFWARDICIVPIPLHPARKTQRGYNQIERVLAKLPRDLRGLVRTDILSRVRDTKTQTELSKEERVRNVAGAFCAREADLARAYIFLIDDVATTGATLSEAARTLKNAGAEVYALALARA